MDYSWEMLRNDLESLTAALSDLTNSFEDGQSLVVQIQRVVTSMKDKESTRLGVAFLMSSVNRKLIQIKNGSDDEVTSVLNDILQHGCKFADQFPSPDEDTYEGLL